MPQEHRTLNMSRGTNGQKLRRTIFALMLLSFFIPGCMSKPVESPEQQARQFIDEHTSGAIDGAKQRQQQETEELEKGKLPVRYQKPSYSLGNVQSNLGDNSFSTVSIPVGAKYVTSGPKPLSHVLQVLAELKSMNVSWASDVDKNAMVHVTIQPEEDFFQAIDNILRQLDYSYELQGNTIIIKHKETKTFHVAMPFVSSSYSTGVGGDVLGSTAGNMSGKLNISSDANMFDIWANIRTNLDQILQIWSAPAATATAGQSATPPAAAATGAASTAAASAAPAAAAAPSSQPTGRGYYSIDRPIGLITVTAPRSLLAKIEAYLNNLKKELYQQVSIEAKIVEVTLTNDNTTGINWANLLNDATVGFGFTLDLAKSGTIIKSSTSVPAGTPGSLLTLNTKSFSLFLDAIKEQGHVEVLANPRISVMNGQPAMLSVGDNVTFVDKVSSTTTDGVTTTSVTTASVMSGLGLGVIATIMENDEIVLSITPVTSELTLPIEYKTFGSNQVGLPKVQLREMNTIVRVKNGEMLVVGGLIDNTSTYADNYVAGLGEIPVAGKAFRTDGTNSTKKELVILMRPQIISF